MEPISESTKCELRPSKRRWESPIDAWTAADLRSEESGVEIVPYRCEGCDGIHLTKRAGGTAELVRDGHFEVFKPTNPATRRLALREFLEDKESVTTDEVAAVADISKPGVGKYMRDLGWDTKRGPGAKWRRMETTPVALHAVDDDTDLDASVSRHPAGKHRGNGWVALEHLGPLVHIPLGDLLAAYVAAGMEVSIRVRKKSTNE